MTPYETDISITTIALASMLNAGIEAEKVRQYNVYAAMHNYNIRYSAVFSWDTFDVRDVSEYLPLVPQPNTSTGEIKE